MLFVGLHKKFFNRKFIAALITNLSCKKEYFYFISDVFYSTEVITLESRNEWIFAELSLVYSKSLVIIFRSIDAYMGAEGIGKVMGLKIV